MILKRIKKGPRLLAVQGGAGRRNWGEGNSESSEQRSSEHRKPVSGVILAWRTHRGPVLERELSFQTHLLFILKIRKTLGAFLALGVYQKTRSSR